MVNLKEKKMVNLNTVVYIFNCHIIKTRVLFLKWNNLCLKNTDLSCKWSLIISMLIFFPVVQLITILYLLNFDFIFLLVFRSAN